MKLGKPVKQARLDSGLTQKEVAEKMNVHPSTVSLLENDKLKLGFASALKFCLAMNLPVWLLVAQGSNDKELKPDDPRYKAKYARIMRSIRG